MFSSLLRGRGEDTSKKEVPAPAVEVAAKSSTVEKKTEGVAIQEKPEQQKATSPEQQKATSSEPSVMQTVVVPPPAACSSSTGGTTVVESKGVEALSVDATIQTQNPVEGPSGVKGNSRSASKASSKGHKNRRRENSKKKDSNREDKSKTNNQTTEVVQAAPNPSGSTQRQTSPVDVHVNCKQTIASLKQSIHHWKSAVEKISRETQATNNLSSDLKLAAIRSICDEAGKKALVDASRGSGSGGNVKKHNRRLRKGQLQKQNGNQLSNQAGQPRQQAIEQRRYTQQNVPRRLARQQQQYAGSNRMSVPYYGQQGEEGRLRGSIDNRDSNRGNNGANYKQTGVSQWNTQRPPENQFSKKQNQLQGGQGRNSHQLQSSVANALTGSPSAQQSLPLLTSAAESDHPVCIAIREELRRVDDIDALTKVILKAEAHKIQDLVERGNRKLEKLKQQQKTSQNST